MHDPQVLIDEHDAHRERLEGSREGHRPQRLHLQQMADADRTAHVRGDEPQARQFGLAHLSGRAMTTEREIADHLRVSGKGEAHRIPQSLRISPFSDPAIVFPRSTIRDL